MTLSQGEADWERQLTEAEGLKKQIFLIETAGSIVGFAALGPANPEDPNCSVAVLDRIYIHPNWWGRKVGKSLLIHCIDWVQYQKIYREIHLWTYESNRRARRFYESQGFISADITRKNGDYPAEVRYDLSL